MGCDHENVGVIALEETRQDFNLKTGEWEGLTEYGDCHGIILATCDICGMDVTDEVCEKTGYKRL